MKMGDTLYLNDVQERILNGMHELLVKQEFREIGISGYSLCMKKSTEKRKYGIQHSTWSENYKNMLKHRIIVPVSIQKAKKKKNSERHERVRYTFRISPLGYFLLLQKNKKIEKIFEYFPDIKELYDRLKKRESGRNTESNPVISPELLNSRLSQTMNMINFSFDRINRRLTVNIEIPYNDHILKIPRYVEENQSISIIFINLFLYNLYRIQYDLPTEISLGDIIRDEGFIEEIIRKRPEIEERIIEIWNKKRKNSDSLSRFLKTDNGKNFKKSIDKWADNHSKEVVKLLQYDPDKILNLIDKEFIKMLLVKKPVSLTVIENRTRR